jgi:hypothetical protein
MGSLWRCRAKLRASGPYNRKSGDRHGRVDCGIIQAWNRTAFRRMAGPQLWSQWAFPKQGFRNPSKLVLLEQITAALRLYALQEQLDPEG